MTARPLALVADDDPAIRELVLIRLERLGYEVLGARDGPEALRLAAERPPELAVLDVTMPGMDGLEVARRLAEAPATRGVPLIFLSARVGEDDVARGYEAGAAEYIKKPFSPRELTEAVKRKQAELALRRAEAETRALADEQAGLLRVAAAVARGESTADVFALVAEVVARLLGAEGGQVVRFAGEELEVLGEWRSPGLGVAPEPLISGTDFSRRSGTSGQSRIAAPIRIETGVWGAIAVAGRLPEPMAPDALARLRRFAELVAVAVTNAETRDELGRRAAEQAALRRIATLVASDAAAPEIFGEAAREAAGVLGAERSSVIRFEDDGAWGAIVGSWTRAGLPEVPPGSRVPLEGANPAAMARSADGPVRLDDLTRLEPVTAAIVGPEAFVSSAAVPVRGRAGLWGALVVTGAARLPAGAESRLARFGELLGLGLASADARAQLAALASTDHLTGLPNQRMFTQVLEGEIERARRHARPLALVVFDLDHFKLINDGHGHQVGDRVLVESATRIAALARSQDTVARIGGEEFAWVLPETDAAGALRAAERARAVVGARPFPVVGAVTVSAGVCELGAAGPGAEAQDLFQLADVALYRAKEGGRNRCEAIRPGAGAPLPAQPGAGDTRRRLLAATMALVGVLDAAEGSEGRHSDRVATLAERLARARGWSRGRARELRQAAQLHDVGKIVVSYAVLRKAGPLDAREYEEVQAHATVGARLLANVLGPEQVTWVRHHHERYDGNGYPDALSGAAIPEGAALLGLAEAWDTMTVARAYARRRAVEDALTECRGLVGRQFSAPDVVALESLYLQGGL